MPGSPGGRGGGGVGGTLWFWQGVATNRKGLLTTFEKNRSLGKSRTAVDGDSQCTIRVGAVRYRLGRHSPLTTAERYRYDWVGGGADTPRGFVCSFVRLPPGSVNVLEGK